MHRTWCNVPPPVLQWNCSLYLCLFFLLKHITFEWSIFTSSFHYFTKQVCSVGTLLEASAVFMVFERIIRSSTYTSQPTGIFYLTLLVVCYRPFETWGLRHSEIIILNIIGLSTIYFIKYAYLYINTRKKGKWAYNNNYQQREDYYNKIFIYFKDKWNKQHMKPCFYLE